MIERDMIVFYRILFSYRQAPSSHETNLIYILLRTERHDNRPGRTHIERQFDTHKIGKSFEEVCSILAIFSWTVHHDECVGEFPEKHGTDLTFGFL